MNRRSFFKTVFTGAVALVAQQVPMNLPVASVPTGGFVHAFDFRKIESCTMGGYFVPTEYAAAIMAVMHEHKGYQTTKLIPLSPLEQEGEA